MTLFPPHGKSQLHIQGRVLVSHSWGHWNIEMHQAQAVRGAALAAELDQQGHWGAVVVIHDSLLTSLEVLEAGRNAVAAMPADRKLVALAWVIAPDVEAYNVLLDRYARMYEGLLPSRVFADQAGAVYWVEKKIEEADRGLRPA